MKINKLINNFFIATLLLSCSHQINQIPTRKPAQETIENTTNPQEAQVSSKEDETLSQWGPVIESRWERLKGKHSLTGLYENAEKPIAYDLIRSANHQIDIEIYEMKDKTFRNLLLNKLSEGVHVRIVKDSNTIGDSCDELSPQTPDDETECKDEKSFVSQLKAKGAQYIWFNKKSLCGVEGRSCFEHGKMIIIDNKTLLLSTGNFNSSSFCSKEAAKCNRDYSYVTRNETVIRDLRYLFELDLSQKNWEFSHVISKSHHGLTISPKSRQRLVTFIQSATKSIWVQNQYLEDPVVNQALVDRAKSGVKVHVQVSDFCTYGNPSDKKKQLIQSIYQEFDEAGIESKTFTSEMLVGGKKGYLHAKAIVVDGINGWVGSINGSTTSTTQNREFGIIFNNNRSVGKLLSIMKTDFNAPEAKDWKDAIKCAK